MPKKTKEVKEKVEGEVTTAEPLLSEKQQKINDVIAQINKDYGKKVIKKADEGNFSFVVRVPTGITSMDRDMVGGFPAGTICEIWGAGNVGKNALLYLTAIQVQRNYGEDAAIAFICSEPFDKTYAKNLGLKIAFSKKEIEEQEEAIGRKFNDEELAYLKEQVGNIVVIPTISAEMALSIATDIASSNEFQLIGLDSIGSLVSTAEQEAEIGKKLYGGITIPMQQFVNKWYMLGTKTTMIMINQVRQVMDRPNKYSPEFHSPGGEALKHMRFVSIFMRRAGKIKKKIGDTEVVIGHEVYWEDSKQKGGGHDGHHGVYHFYKGEEGTTLGPAIYEDLVETAVEDGVIDMTIDKRKKIYTYKEFVCESLESMIECIQKNNLFDQIRNDVFQVNNIKCLFRYQ
jgi:RecA/RadA recombinase